MSQPHWKRFEKLVAAIHRAEAQGAKVVWNDRIEGRQFDVSLRFRHGLHDYLTVVECKDSARKVSVEKVEAFVTKSAGARANKAVMVSRCGFQAGCEDIANKAGIELLVLSESYDQNIDLTTPTPGLVISEIRFAVTGGTSEFVLDDSFGRCEYLARNSRLVSPMGTTTPRAVIERWKEQQGSAVFAHPVQDVEVPLPSGSTLHCPYEQPVDVTALLFQVEVRSFYRATKPTPDMHVREALAARVELRSTTGALTHSAMLRDLALDLGAPLQADRFYVATSLGFHYHCDSIDAGIVHWTLVESYQFGELIQGTFTAKLEDCTGYVEVTDEATLRRLRLMLADMRSRT